MAGTAQQLRLRLFVEGVEVPVIAAQVQALPNSPAACSIQIPPMAEGTRFLPRSTVHLFFLDFYDTTSPFVSKRGDITKKQHDPTMYEQALIESQKKGEDIDIDNLTHQKYKLLFGGEMVGFQWTKNEANRSLVLQCVDWSNYWDYAYQWNNTDLFGPGIKALFSGGATNLFTDFLEDEGQAIIRIIQQPPAQFPKMKGLLGGIVHLLEAIGGSYYYGKQFAGQNIFFSLAELRLHITQMITAFTDDPTSSRLLNADGYDGLFGRTLGGLGSQVSIRQAINALMGVIFHETYPIPSPMYVPGSGGSVTGRTRVSLEHSVEFKALVELAQQLQSALQNISDSLSATGEGAPKPRTRVNFFDEREPVLPEEFQRMYDFVERSIKAAVLRLRDKQLQPLKGYFNSALQQVKNARAKTLKWKPGASDTIISSIKAPLSDAIAKLKRVTEFQLFTPAGKGTPARLNQQIFRPDVWFTAPPRCNVLFPEHYHSLQYARSFLQEPTRFLLKTNEEFFGEDELFDQFYFAPKALTVKQNKRDLQALLSNDLLDHELFTGILPVFEKMGELNIFAARSGTVSAKNSKVGLAQRSTNFLYFKYRFAARQMTVSGRFNPYVAPGFPGLIIDKYVDAASLLERQQLVDKYGGTSSDIQKLLGTHFLGNFTEVTHTVDQRQGRTDINVSYARQPEESTEFLGANAKDQKVQRRFGNDALRSTDVAAFSAPRVYSLGPNYGQIVKVEDVTEQYQTDSAEGAPVLPVFQGPRREGTGESRIRVPIGLPQKAEGFGEDVVALVGNRYQYVTFRAYRLQEEVPRYRREVVDLPAEELIRPGWYGDCWHTSKVGAVYEQFFGTGAITDKQQIADPAGASTGARDRDAEDALAEAAQGVDFEDPRTLAPALLTLDQNSSIQDAVAFLVQVYSYIRMSNLDVDEFVKSYVWRPIASMVDMFGTQDLQLSADGHTVVQGIEGFHSRAFGPYDDLFGLVTNDLDSIVGIKRGSTVAQKADVRRRRQEAVREYVSALLFARAILG